MTKKRVIDEPGFATLQCARQADPHSVIHSTAAGLIDVRLLTRGRITGLHGVANNPAPVRRAGSDDLDQLPSRMGNTLRWPDGRITTLCGTPLVEVADPNT